MKNFYNILAIDKNATVAEIKKAYKHLMLENHPDRKRENYDEKVFKEIQQAYEMLCDTNIRIAYNKYISIDGFENETEMFLQLHERYSIFKKFHMENSEYYTNFKNSYVELYEFIDIELCYIYLSDSKNFLEYVQFPDHLNFYMFYRELETEKRFTFEEAFILYAEMLEDGYIEFSNFFLKLQELYEANKKSEKVNNTSKGHRNTNYYSPYNSDENPAREYQATNNYQSYSRNTNSKTHSKNSDKNNNMMHIIMAIIVGITFFFCAAEVVELNNQVCTIPVDGIESMVYETLGCGDYAINESVEHIKSIWLVITAIELLIWVVIGNYRKNKNYRY